MTVWRLLQECDSRELSEWLVFLEADAARAEERRTQRDDDRRLMGEEG